MKLTVIGMLLGLGLIIALAGCTGVPTSGEQAADDAKVVNAACPIMGNKVDPHNVPDDLTREFRGQRVGFCCAACPAQWDKLSDEEKKAKLQTVMEKGASNGGHGDHQ